MPPSRSVRQTRPSFHILLHGLSQHHAHIVPLWVWNECEVLFVTLPHTSAGPEPGLTRDPTYGWIKHGGLDLQLVDTAGWKKASAVAPTQAPTATANTNTSTTSSSSSKKVTAGSGPRTSSSSVSGQASASAAVEADGKLLGKQLADASLAQARRALSACHVVVLLLDAPRLLTIQQVRVWPV